MIKRNKKITPLLLKDLFGPKPFYSPGCEFGTEYQQSAKEEYLKRFQDRHFHRCGFVVNQDYPFIGATPHAVLHSGIVEVKCVYKSKEATLQEM